MILARRLPGRVLSAAQLLNRLFGATANQLEAIPGLRNRAGTGHGRAGVVPPVASYQWVRQGCFVAS